MQKEMNVFDPLLNWERHLLLTESICLHGQGGIFLQGSRDMGCVSSRREDLTTCGLRGSLTAGPSLYSVKPSDFVFLIFTDLSTRMLFCFQILTLTESHQRIWCDHKRLSFTGMEATKPAHKLFGTNRESVLSKLKGHTAEWRGAETISLK